MDSGGRRVCLGLPWPPEPRAGGRECGEQGAGRGCRLLLRTPTGPLDGPSHRPPPAASGRSARGHRGGGGEGEGRARPETHGRPDQAAPGWPQCLGLTRQRQRQLPRALSKETGSLRWGRPAGGTARLGPPPAPPGHGGRRRGDLHMKGLTVLWMCLCCLRPEDVAKVLPQSGQACARAPTCWDRMCRCRLLGSVNTWGTDAVGRRPSTCPGRRTGPPAALPPAQARAAVATPGGPQRAVEAPPEPVPSLHDNSQETCGQGGCEAGAQRETVCSWGPGRAPGPCRPPLPRGESGPASCPQHGPGLSGTCSWRGGHVTFTQFSHSKRLPLSWDIWWRMRLDFQLKALGHWSHLYSLSSVWTTMCCSRLRREHRGHGRARLPPLPGGEGPSVPRGPFSAVVTAASTPCSEVRARPGTRPSTAPLDRPVGWRRRGGLPERARALSETTQGPGPHVLAALRDDLNLEADLVPESKGAHRRHEPEGGSGPGSPRRPLRGLGVRAGHAGLGRGVGWDVGVG